MSKNTKVSTMKVSDIIASTLKQFSLPREPQNKDKGASGKYNAWSQEQREYNENVVRPFRLAVAQGTYDAIFAIVAKYNVSPEDVLALDSLIHDGLEYFEKCPTVFKAHERPSKATNETMSREKVIDYLVATGTPRQVAEAMVK